MDRFRNYISAAAGLVILAGTFTVFGPFVDQGQSAGVPVQLAAISQQLDDVLDAVNNISTNGDLRGVTQNWDKKLDSTNGEADGCNSDRFTCIMPNATFPNGAAVRDNETGLVWERSPSTALQPAQPGLLSALFLGCYNKFVGGSKGLRFPKVEELSSLLDPAQNNPALPIGHPFNNIQSDVYWTPNDLDHASIGKWYGVSFSDSSVQSVGAGDQHFLLCVRDGQG